MRISKNLKDLGFAIGLLSITLSCDPAPKKLGEVTDKPKQEANEGSAELTIHELSDPDGMNPITSRAANSLYIQNNIYSKLLVYDQETLELSPQLAVSRPEIKVLEDGAYAGGMSLTYEIHPEATWDNGTPITAEDYVFTIKAIKNPRVSSAQIRPYFEFMDKIEIDPTDNKKFTIYSKERYFRAEESSGDDPFVLPEYHYDPEGLMSEFTIEQLSDLTQADALMKDPKIERFANQFNAAKMKRQPAEIVGSGPYKFVEWTTGQRVVLERKKDWWGDKVKGNKMLEAFPTKIIYKTIPDLTAAITSAKDGQIDVIHTIPPTKFIDLKDDTKFSTRFDLSTPDQFIYYYIGFNTKRPQFRDKKVRRAIAHLIDRNDMIESIFEGMAMKTNGPINPKKEYYNKDLKDIEYDIEQAKALLDEAGWKDVDGDNIRDKMIDGKQESLTIEYKYNQGHLVRKNIGQLLKDEASRVGIEVKLTPIDFATLLDDADKRDFDMVALAWVKTPGLDDMKQVWHTDGDKEGGSNRLGFGTPESDKIIDQIRVTLDPEVRKKLYLRIQEIIYEEQPCIFLFVPSELIAIHNRFDGAETSPMRPGYRDASFKLRE
ncbi:MAG: Oligopeptide ABC transporter, periplasmic oligopeptide-binding protein OppA (TC 3.A.1.5.1) [uncultured Aureispira sp.]|uniref:Oligopeptide ABC transporter, periplasmic oligopeptide-binding protein OppA (TC 3.A.1.5.1) n=1 Tax=uncultured Aureispira sp. TaxID=1331704 RepID=A0A6S6TLT0_9BACT|nr:MAG: Oligopeptide ABC transporter, periplasmic oligopeptide-binding protein OppA (TC 3.A.1.5.1) [uncultured Aureispira sp.]